MLRPGGRSTRLRVELVCSRVSAFENTPTTLKGSHVSILLEVCIDSISSAKAAKEGGANRLEVCSSLAGGGTTPSFGLVEHCAIDLEMPVMMMIRPHDGNFVYNKDDLDAMLTDIEVAKSIGAQGVVFGALTPNLELDLAVTKTLVETADELEVTFHRAFDVVRDPLATLAKLEELGVKRVLTSGQKATAMELSLIHI